MVFDPKRGNYYRMPIFFGPTPGPRQWPDTLQCDFNVAPKRRIIGASFLSNADQLQSFLPTCFTLWGEPVVTVEAQYITEIGWLAGRGYNMCDVKFNVVYQGAGKPVHGTLVLVRFESLCDPILSGREELGHNKLWCDIPELKILDGRYSFSLSWLGYQFLHVSVSNLKPVEQASKPNPQHQGLLSYKYIPKTGEWGVADVEYATLTPPAQTGKTLSSLKGEGNIAFVKSTWQDLPTLHHLVNAFESLENHGWRGGYLQDAEGGHSAAATYKLD
ncbi:MAG: acetoacetate decarboxylase family protein [Steroidobacteraceae bacterium]